MLLSSSTFTRLLLVFAGFLVAGCRPVANEPVAPGYDYFPLTTGQFTIYDVWESHYVLNSPPVERIYQLKEVIGAAYADVTGRPAYRLLRYRRSAEGQPWQADSAWSARLVNNEAIRTENGRDFVKLVFPIGDQLTWDGNRRNNLGEDAYVLRNNNRPYRVLDKQFDETVTVVAQDDSTLVAQDKRVEVLARRVGLIYKERVLLQFCASAGCVGKNQVDYGIRQVYRLRAHGTE